MFLEKTVDIYELEYSAPNPDAQSLNGQYTRHQKYFATRDEAEDFDSKNCQKGDGMVSIVTPLQAVLEDDGRWWVVTRGLELLVPENGENPDFYFNWIGDKQYSLSAEWEERFSAHPGHLIAISLHTTDTSNQFIIAPAIYEDEIEMYVFVSKRGHIYFAEDPSLSVTLEKSDLSEAKADEYRAAQAVIVKNGETKDSAEMQDNIVAIETEIAALHQKREKDDGVKEIDENIFKLFRVRDQLREIAEYPMPRP